MKILIADDSKEVRRSLIKLLSPLDQIDALETAADVAEAIRASDRLHPDILILDINMPGGSGFDVLAHVKQFDQPPVVVVLTNFASPQFRRKSLQEGADFFFDKSVEFEKVLDVIQNYSD